MLPTQLWHLASCIFMSITDELFDREIQILLDLKKSSDSGLWHFGLVHCLVFREEHSVLETVPCHITWWKNGEAPTELTPTERALHHHWNCDKQGILIVNIFCFSPFYRERRRRFDWWRSLVLTRFVLQSQQMSQLDRASRMIQVMAKILKVSTGNNNYWMYHTV